MCIILLPSSLSEMQRDRRLRFNLQDCHHYRFLHRVSLCVAATCMNVNRAPGIYGIQRVKDGHGFHKHLSHWCDKGKRSLVPSKITVINVVFCIISSRLNLQLPLRVSNSRFVQNFPSIMYISTVLKSASPLPEHPLKKVPCAGSSFTRRT